MFTALLLLACLPVAEPAAEKATDKQRGAAIKLAEQLTTGEFDKVPETFNLTMRLLLSSAQLRAAWEGTTSAYGKFERIGESRVATVDTYVIVFVTLEFARGKLDTKVVYDQNNRVSGLFLASIKHHRTSMPRNSAKSKFRSAMVSFRSREHCRCQRGMVLFQQSCWCMALGRMTAMKRSVRTNHSAISRTDSLRKASRSCVTKSGRGSMDSRWRC